MKKIWRKCKSETKYHSKPHLQHFCNCSYFGSFFFFFCQLFKKTPCYLDVLFLSLRHHLVISWQTFVQNLCFLLFAISVVLRYILAFFLNVDISSLLSDCCCTFDQFNWRLLHFSCGATYFMETFCSFLCDLCCNVCLYFSTFVYF